MTSTLSTNAPPSPFPLGPATPPRSKARPIGYLPSLDGWRCVAILWVLGCHGSDSIRNLFGSSLGGILNFLHDNGEFGVHIFFGISGFLITARLLEEHMVHDRISLKGFYIRRACRILPPVLAFLGCVAILGILGLIPVALKHWCSAMFFYANYLPGDPWYVSHFWSLAVEEHFYFFWPALLLIFGVRRGLATSVVLALAVAAWRVLHYKIPALGIPNGETIPHTDLQADGLLWGCAAAFLYANAVIRQRLRAILTPTVWVLAIAAIVACVVWDPHGWLMRQVLLLASKILIPLVIVGTTLRPQWFAGRLLEAAPIRWVGRLSYSLYLWQQVFLVWDGARSSHLGFLQTFPTNIGAALLLATASYYIVERPLIKVGHHLAKPVSPGRTDLGAAESGSSTAAT